MAYQTIPPSNTGTVTVNTTLVGDGSAGDPLGITNPWNTVGPTVGDSQDLEIATGLSATDVGIEFMGDLAALAGSETFYLRPDNVDTDCVSYGISENAAGVVAGITAAANFLLVDGGVTQTPHFHGFIGQAGDGARLYRATGNRGPNTAYFMQGQFAAAGGHYTTITIHGDTADSIKAGSVFRWRRMGP